MTPKPSQARFTTPLTRTGSALQSTHSFLLEPYPARLIHHLHVLAVLRRHFAEHFQLAQDPCFNPPTPLGGSMACSSIHHLDVLAVLLDHDARLYGKGSPVTGPIFVVMI